MPPWEKATGPLVSRGPVSLWSVWPISRVLSGKRRFPGDHFSCRAVADAVQAQGLSTLPVPAGRAGRGLLGLARDGVCRAPSVARWAVRSYRTLSPLPVPAPAGTSHRRSALCGTFPRPRPPPDGVCRAGGRYPPSCPAVLGLSSRTPERAGPCGRLATHHYCRCPQPFGGSLGFFLPVSPILPARSPAEDWWSLIPASEE